MAIPMTLNDEMLQVDLSGVDLREADLSGVDLSGVDLREADLREADLRGANLRRSPQRRLALRWGDLRRADLCGANLCGADLCGANLCGADLCEADLCGADLSGVDLCGANLREADLCGATLCWANLRGANLREADLCGANLRGADLSGAIWDTQTRWAEGFTPPAKEDKLQDIIEDEANQISNENETECEVLSCREEEKMNTKKVQRITWLLGYLLEEDFSAKHLNALCHIIGLFNDCAEAEAEVFTFAERLWGKYAGPVSFHDAPVPGGGAQ